MRGLLTVLWVGSGVGCNAAERRCEHARDVVAGMWDAGAARRPTG